MPHFNLGQLDVERVHRQCQRVAGEFNLIDAIIYILVRVMDNLFSHIIDITGSQ
jgi:hypothetical protein